jgi:PST family polysaccharide transporter
MRELVVRFSKSKFTQVSFFSGLATLVKILTALILSKFVSIYLGPKGLSIIGQFTSFITILVPLSTGGILNGVTKYISEYSDIGYEKKRSQLLVTSYQLVLMISLVLCFVIIGFNSTLSFWLFHTFEYAWLLNLLGVFIFSVSLSNWGLSVINGLLDFKAYNLINIISNVLSLLVSSILVIFYSLEGALIAMISTQVLIFAISFSYLIKKKGFQPILSFSVNKAIVISLLDFSLMAIVTALTSQLIPILIRQKLIDGFGKTQAGYWEAINRISSMHLLFITTTLITYYLPKLSSTQDKVLVRSEVYKVSKIVIPIVFCSSFIIYLFRDLEIEFLFSKEFIEMRSLFLFQCVGDFLKISSWIFAMIMLAKAKRNLYIVSEIVFSFSFWVFTILLTSESGVIGVTQAYALNYFLYAIFSVFVFIKVTK